MRPSAPTAKNPVPGIHSHTWHSAGHPKYLSVPYVDSEIKTGIISDLLIKQEPGTPQVAAVRMGQDEFTHVSGGQGWLLAGAPVSSV